MILQYSNTDLYRHDDQYCSTDLYHHDDTTAAQTCIIMMIPQCSNTDLYLHDDTTAAQICIGMMILQQYRATQKFLILHYFPSDYRNA